MDLVISFILYTLALLTLTQAIDFYKNTGTSKRQYLLFSLTAVCSTIWSFGFGMIGIQENVEVARLWRAVGMVGTLLFLHFCTILLLEWVQGARLFKTYAWFISVTGIFLWPFLVGEKAAVYQRAPIGMTYQFTDYLPNTIYNIYCVWVAVNYFISLFYILRQTTRKKMRIVIRRIFACLFVVVFGMIFDTVLPLFGFNALPGSTLSQGIGVLIIASALKYQRRTEMTMENSAQFIYSSVDTPLLIYDYEWNFCVANNGAMNFFNSYKIDVTKKPIWDIFNITKKDITFSADREIIEAECNNTDRFCRIEIYKTYDECHDVTGYIALIIDLTEKRNLIEKLKKSEYNAELANQAKSSFLARMSHEIRTPINGILGMNDMILQKSEDSQITSYAKMVKLSAHNLLELVNDILDISKIEANKMMLENAVYQLTDLLQELAATNRIKAQEKGLRFEVEIKNELPVSLNGDEKKLRQILMNIISNAIKYTRIGTVSIEVEGYTREEQYYLQINVKDTGIGIKDENIDKIFNAFERVDITKNQGIEGTGLGLSIVKNLVELMNGAIEVHSNYGVGSEFIVIVPQKPVSEETFHSITLDDEKEQCKPDEQVTLKIPDKKILIVDDNEINRIVATELIGYTKAQIDTVESGKECLATVKEKRYDFILLDHIMPEMDGIQTLEELKKLPAEQNLSKDAIIIVLTANAIQGAKEEYIRKGFDDYLAKPIDMEEVQAVLKKYC